MNFDSIRNSNLRFYWCINSDRIVGRKDWDVEIDEVVVKFTTSWKSIIVKSNPLNELMNDWLISFDVEFLRNFIEGMNLAFLSFGNQLKIRWIFSDYYQRKWHTYYFGIISNEMNSKTSTTCSYIWLGFIAKHCIRSSLEGMKSESVFIISWENLSPAILILITWNYLSLIVFRSNNEIVYIYL